MRVEYMLRRQVDLVLTGLLPIDRRIMQVAIHTGLRVSDVLSLRTEQLSPRMWVLEKKTKKRRQVGLPQWLLDDVRSHAGEVWAFPGRDGRLPRTRQAVWKDVKRVALALRLPQNIGPHSARKVYAVRLRERYGDIKHVQNALRHSSECVTLIYAMADKMLAAKYPHLLGS